MGHRVTGHERAELVKAFHGTISNSHRRQFDLERTPAPVSEFDDEVDLETFVVTVISEGVSDTRKCVDEREEVAADKSLKQAAESLSIT